MQSDPLQTIIVNGKVLYQRVSDFQLAVMLLLTVVLLALVFYVICCVDIAGHVARVFAVARFEEECEERAQRVKSRSQRRRAKSMLRQVPV